MVDVDLPWFGKVKNNPTIATSSASETMENRKPKVAHNDGKRKQGKGEQKEHVDGAKRDNVDAQPMLVIACCVHWLVILYKCTEMISSICAKNVLKN